MLHRHTLDADPMADPNVSERNNTAEVRKERSPQEDGSPFHTICRNRDVAPVAYMPYAIISHPGSRNLRRMLTREQGRALEMIGHAVDYLNDCYLYEGDDKELINVGGSSREAIQILASLRWQIFQSAPVREPRTRRFWNALFRRQKQDRPVVVFQSTQDHDAKTKRASVLPLSSSR